MRLRLRPQPRPAQRLKLTPRMKLAMEILHLPLAELKEYIASQLEENPLLTAEEYHSRGISPADENYATENTAAASGGLQDHLLKQLRLSVLGPEEYRAGELIISRIDPDGYFREDLEEIAESAGIETEKARQALKLVRSFEPPGVGAGDLRECLLLQLKAEAEKNSLAIAIVDKYLSFLARKRYADLAARLKVPLKNIQKEAKKISRLEPRPGRRFQAQETPTIIPDAFLKESSEGYEIVLNRQDLPELRINQDCLEMIKGSSPSSPEKEYLVNKLAAAQGLIYGINRRGETLLRIIREMVLTQKTFLEKGPVYLRPLSLSQLAQRLGRHKSTLSRAIAGKYIHGPWGTLALKDFLSRRLKQTDGTILSSKAVKAKIRKLIESEKRTRPLTDREIAGLLSQKGITIRRRTVAKYRGQMKILPSSWR